MIYYVEDDASIRDLALYALRQAGFEACGFPDATAFFAALAAQPARAPQLILLDIMLPGTDGLAILARLRATPATRHIPIMMLTAKGTEYDKVRGLDAGADDYLAKPFGMMELVSRCRALLRRTPAVTTAAAAMPHSEALTCGHVTLDPLSREASCAGTRLDLTLKEFDLLKKLLSEQNRVFTRAQLLEDVWGITFVGETRTVDTHIQTLRRKLNETHAGAGELIETVRGVGYRAVSGKANGKASDKASGA